MTSTTPAVPTTFTPAPPSPEAAINPGSVTDAPRETSASATPSETDSAHPEATPQDSQLDPSVSLALILSPSGMSVIETPSVAPSLELSAPSAKLVSPRKHLSHKLLPLPYGTRTKRSRYILPETAEVEASLCNEIDDLWTIHKEKYGALRGERRELEEVRAKLGKHLSEYKQILVGSGRGGKWSKYLREVKIPKATADRYVNKWELTQSPKVGNLLSEEIVEPSADTIAALVKKIKPQVVRTLTTEASVSIFLAELTAAIQPLDRKE